MKKQELIKKLMAKKVARFNGKAPVALCIIECCDGGGHCTVSA